MKTQSDTRVANGRFPGVLRSPAMEYLRRPSHYWTALKGTTLLVPLFFSMGVEARIGEDMARTGPISADARVGFLPPRIAERGENYRIWRTVKCVTNMVNGIDEVRYITNRYTEIGSGICYRTPAGEWADSHAEVVLAADGGAETTRLPHKLYCQPDIYSVGAVRLTLPEGEVMTSTIRGLYYHEVSTGRRVLVSPITNSIGVIWGGTKVIYSNCFAGLHGDVVLSVSQSGLEQDVVIHDSEMPFSPKDAGFDEEFTVCEAWTEYFQSPSPYKETRESRLLPTAREQTRTNKLTDETLSFGKMAMYPGRMFSLDESGGGGRASDSSPVFKRWMDYDGGSRRFLIESVRWDDLRGRLQRLRTNSVGRTNAAILPNRVVPTIEAVPPKVLAQAAASVGMQIADARTQQAIGTEPAVIIDYNIVNSMASYHFEAGQTYLVNSPVTINNVVLSGDAVIKMGEPTSKIQVTGSITCKTGPGRMAIVTSKYDSSVGEYIASGDPNANRSGWPALEFTGPGVRLEYLRISYARGGVMFYNPDQHNQLRHSQIGRCDYGVYSVENSLHVQNTLVYDIATIGFEGHYFTLKGEHVTMRGAANLAVDWFSDGDVTLVHSIFVNVPLCSAVHNIVAPSLWLTSDDPSVFRSRGGGNFYLADDSPYRGIGATAIDPMLRDELKGKSTYPPLQLPSLISANMVLAPVVPRNSGPKLDIGYSYDAADYYASAIAMQNCTVLLTNGVTLAIDRALGAHGIELGAGAKLISEGLPTKMNKILHTRYFQEQPPTGAAMVLLKGGSSPASEIHLRFTDIAAREGIDTSIGSGPGLQRVSLTDCRIRDGVIWPGTVRTGLTNNLFEHSWLPAYFGEIYIYNNTFVRGRVQFVGDYAIQARDNMFDRLAELSNSEAPIGNSHNAYYQTPLLVSSGPNYNLGSALSYQSGPLGDFYLPSGSSMLLNAGHRLPSAAGLFHHTTQVGQIKEGAKAPAVNVDVGFHYVAVAAGNFATQAGAVASQSSTDWNGPPHYGNNGNVNGTWSPTGVSVTHTAFENQPWWYLNLGAIREIGAIKLWNRTDCCGERLSNFYVLVSDTDFQSLSLASALAQPNIKNIYFPHQVGVSELVEVNRTGRFLRVHLAGQNYLSLAEVEVFPPLRALDADGDSLGDYFEDRNGNNILDSGETNFQVADTDGDGVNDSAEAREWRTALVKEANVLWLSPRK